MAKKADPILKELQAAAKGLLWPSETDAPIEAFAWPGASGPPDEAALRVNAEIEEDAPVEQITLAQLTKTVPKDSRADFKPLLDALGKLSGTTVFKVGEVNIAVYVVGRTADGRFAGIKTEVVET
jgi:hypothetical protein